MNGPIIEWKDNEGDDVAPPPDQASWSEIVKKVGGASARARFVSTGTARWRLMFADRPRIGLGSDIGRIENLRDALRKALLEAGLPVD